MNMRLLDNGDTEIFHDGKWTLFSTKQESLFDEAVEIFEQLTPEQRVDIISRYIR